MLVPLYAQYLAPSAYGNIAQSDSIGQFIVRGLGLPLDESLRRLYFQYIYDQLKCYVSTVLWSALGTIGFMLVSSMTVVPAIMRHFAPHFEAAFDPYIVLSVGAAVGLHVLLFRQTPFQVEPLPEKYLADSATSFVLTVTFAVTFVVLLRVCAYGMLLGKV